MRVLNLITILSAFSLLVACGGETSSGTLTDATGSEATSETDTTSGNTMGQSTELPATHNCTLPHEVLDGNQFWIREKGILVAIAADSTTMDEEFGASHRVLEVYNTESCQLVQREVLPVNVSPDFPYFLAEITYNTDSELIGIRGANTIYIYDVANRRLLPKLQPKYLSNRMSEDAQSGNILRLEVWESYLIGYAEDQGTFAFKLGDGDTPAAVLPVAEFKTGENEFIPLFAFPSPDGKTQLALPSYNRDTDQFSVNTLYSTPQDINLSIQANARNNRYIVLRRNDANRSAIAIDMQNRKLLDVPADMATQSTQAVLQWARQQ